MGQGFLFPAAIQDVFSRRIIGWSMRGDLKTDLVLDALGMAVSRARTEREATRSDSTRQIGCAMRIVVSAKGRERQQPTPERA